MKKTKKEPQKNLSLIIVSCVIGIILIAGLIITLIIINSEPKVEIILSDKLTYEINTEVKLLSLISSAEGIEILTKDEIINTSELGEKEIIIKYKNKRQKEKYFSFKIKIIDTTAPVIEAGDTITTNIGTKADLLKDVKVTDNSLEEIIPTIEGEYDFNKTGTYKLKYIAQDKSGNKGEKEFTLTVKSISIKTTGYYVYKTKETWHEMKFEKNGKAWYLPWFCPGYGCGGYSLSGTYKISGNKLIATFTHETGDVEDTVKLKKPEKWEFKIISEKQLELNGKKYNYQKTYQG